MEVYLVGGAVRDGILGRPVIDKDFVVVGATVEQMLENNFIQVGADFPVFLHPTSKQEYALARTERKSGTGYKGFLVHADSEVTLEQDLSRRDLTINAMAIQVHGLFDDTPLTGEVVDPFDGLEDIGSKKLRHVSDAFSEDPLRVLRVARFYGRLYDDGFEVAEPTMQLLTQLAQSGELQHLTKERVWTETSRALMQSAPQAYWQLMYNIGALNDLLPQLATTWQDKDNRQHTYHSLQLSAQFNFSLTQRWAIVMSSFAPFINSIKDLNESHDDWTHSITQISEQYKLPKKLTQFALLYAEYANYLSEFDSLNAEQMMQLITATKAQKDATLLKDLIAVSHIEHMARQQTKLRIAVDKFNNITIKDIDALLKGAQIGEALTQLRIQALDTL